MHPRLKHYPHHADYVAHANEFRPFVTSMGEPFFKSSSLNTDAFGFRAEKLADGQKINLQSIRNDVDKCDLLLGNSTAFGGGASSDEHTISSCLTRSGRLVLNWGIRGAVAQQELIAYLSLKYLLPPTRNILLLTGINDLTIASIERPFVFPEFGTVISEPHFYRLFNASYSRASPVGSRHAKFMRIADNLYIRSPLVRRAAMLLKEMNINPKAADSQPESLDDRMALELTHVSNSIETWGWIQQASSTRVHYILQPAIGWCDKALTATEKECFDEDLKTIPSLQVFGRRDLYERFRDKVRLACDKAGIFFYDANQWLNEKEFEGKDVFVDICHLNDLGQQLLAEKFLSNVHWNE
ncbi:MAG TPA: hypothetical protein VKS43_01770 [Burkholderiales bacterium]|nr:hypothetical protein [Burkholderiales bacterium]